MADRIILGQNANYSTDPAETGLNNNILAAGAPGSGKTVSIVEPILIETMERSHIIAVTKRRLVYKYAPELIRRGYNLLDLNMVEPGAGNVGYDPLRIVSTYQDISFLAESIVMADPRKNVHTNADPYWDKAAVSLLSALIAYVLRMATIRRPTLTDVINLLGRLEITDCGSSIETTLDGEFERLAARDPNGFAVSCWRTFRNLPTRTALCVFSTLNTTVDGIFTDDIKAMMARDNQVCFRDIADRKTILFVTTSPVNKALHTFCNIFYGQAFKELFEYAEKRPDGMLPIPVNVIADDFATGSRILDFAEYISIFREKRISCCLLLQSESQLVKMYGPHDAVTIINSCDTYVYMGGQDLETARNVSVKLDAPLEDVLWMPVGKEIIFRRGQKPLFTERYRIQEDERYRRITAEHESSMRAEEERRNARPRGDGEHPGRPAEPVFGRESGFPLLQNGSRENRGMEQNRFRRRPTA